MKVNWIEVLQNRFIDCFTLVSANYHKPLCTYGNMVINRMNTKKIVIALVAVAALTLVVVGIASAQIAPNQTPVGATPNTASPNGGFFGWIGRCFGYGTNQGYGNQYVAPQAPSDGSTPAPTPYQGGYRSGYGYGPCMGLR